MNRENQLRQAFRKESKQWGIPDKGDAWKDGAMSDEAIERAVQIQLAKKPPLDDAEQKYNVMNARKQRAKRAS